jgi:hypothetical protein
VLHCVPRKLAASPSNRPPCALLSSATHAHVVCRTFGRSGLVACGCFVAVEGDHAKPPDPLSLTHPPQHTDTLPHASPDDGARKSGKGKARKEPKGGDTAEMDSRFDHIGKDRRYKPITRKQSTVKIDSRFKGMFTEKGFTDDAGTGVSDCLLPLPPAGGGSGGAVLRQWHVHFCRHPPHACSLRYSALPVGGLS